MTGTSEEPMPTVQRAEREEQTMTESGDRSFDWVAALALISGVAVLIPSFAPWLPRFWRSPRRCCSTRSTFA